METIYITLWKLSSQKLNSKRPPSTADVRVYDRAMNIYLASHSGDPVTQRTILPSCGQSERSLMIVITEPYPGDDEAALTQSFQKTNLSQRPRVVWDPKDLSHKYSVSR